VGFGAAVMKSPQRIGDGECWRLQMEMEREMQAEIRVHCSPRLFFLSRSPWDSGQRRALDDTAPSGRGSRDSEAAPAATAARGRGRLPLHALTPSRPHGKDAALEWRPRLARTGFTGPCLITLGLGCRFFPRHGQRGRAHALSASG